MRKELAWAPVSGKENGCKLEATDAAPTGYAVRVPSFIATVDSGPTAKTPSNTGLDHLQYFATGEAATNLSLRADVRSAMLRRVDPAATPSNPQGPRPTSTTAEALAQRASALLDRVPDSRLDDAWRLAVESGLIEPSAAVPNGASPEDKRTALKSRAGGNSSEIRHLETFVTRLEHLHR